MFGSIGPAELVLIFVIALLVFGPKKLPSDEIKGRIEEEIEASELKDIRKDIQTGVDDLKTSVKDITSGVTDIQKEIQKDIEGHEIGEGPKVT
ncbi:MAG: mttA/Hcf106 family [Candidatus Aminicenantes bacterium]|nr:mttA/Hcf106 family [Candidatus Aminicenantes bacterium]